MTTKFQSKAFAINFFRGEQLEAFKGDIVLLSKIEPEKLELILDSVKKAILTKTEREELKIYNEMVESNLVSSIETAIASHRSINYFFQKFSDENTKEDTPEQIVNDLISLNLEVTNLSSIKKLLSFLKQESEWYKQYELKELSEKGLFPHLKGIGTTVELRGVFNREMEIGEKIDSYTDDVRINKNSSVIPIISVSITLDSGTPDRFCFQASPERINWLIEHLKAGLHKLQMLEENHKK